MKAPILASGYITYAVDNLVSKTIDENIFIKYVIFRDYLRPKNVYFYSEGIYRLYKELLENDKDILSIDNRVAVIKLAKQLFDNATLLEWVKLQKHNPLLSMNHVRFLKETVHFIMGGKRTIDNSTWVRLIEPSLNDSSNTVEIQEALDDVINKCQHELTGSLSEHIATWLKRPGGYVDLIYSLYILYGSRDKVFTI